MSRRIELIRQMRDAAEVKHRLVRLALRRADELRSALEALDRGDGGAVEELNGISSHVPYDGAVWMLRTDNILQAEADRGEAFEQLQALDAEETALESDR